MQQTAVFDADPATDDAAVLSSVTDSLLMFNTAADCINFDTKLLPPFETFIPPLRPVDTPANTTPLIRCHNYTDWSTGPHDVIWWSSAANYQPSPAIMTSHYAVSDVTDDVKATEWPDNWQLSRKLTM